ncbi:hypothetical protein [Geodermatophilus amargosae]
MSDCRTVVAAAGGPESSPRAVDRAAGAGPRRSGCAVPVVPATG